MELMEIYAPEPRKCVYRPYEDGPVLHGSVKVETEFAAVKHGTEFVSFRAEEPFIAEYYDEEFKCFLPRASVDGKFGMRPGNMWVGHVTEVGQNTESVSLGQRVAGYGPLRPTHILAAKDCIMVPPSMTWKEAVCYDPMQFALGGVRDGHVRIGDHVAVFGLGAIGLITAQLAKLSGAEQVIVVDPIAQRRKAAIENGADAALDPTACDAGFEIRKLTNKRGADVALECSGAYTALQAAIRSVAYAGNIAVVGWYKECHGVLNLGREAHFNQPNIIVSRACSEPNRDYPRWNFERLCAAGWHLLSSGSIKCENIVDPVVPFEKAADMYMHIEQNLDLSVKMGVSF
jgi:threonine dehydrogenase-like Zn-dependent dehydrogenase